MTLGMNDTQDMQDALVSLKNMLTTIQSDLQEVQTSMTVIASGSYVGNNQSSFSILYNADRMAKIVFIISIFDDVYIKCSPFGFGISNIFSGVANTGNGSSSSNAVDVGGVYTMQINQTNITFNLKAQLSNNRFFNNNGVTYNYILLG